MEKDYKKILNLSNIIIVLITIVIYFFRTINIINDYDLFDVVKITIFTHLFITIINIYLLYKSEQKRNILIINFLVIILILLMLGAAYNG